MLISSEVELRRALADVYEELVHVQETRDVDPLRAPYTAIADLIEATLRDDIKLKGAIHGGAYLDDVDMTKYLLAMYTDELTMDHFNDMMQKAYRRHLSDYVLGELYDYIDEVAGDDDGPEPLERL